MREYQREEGVQSVLTVGVVQKGISRSFLYVSTDC